MDKDEFIKSVKENIVAYENQLPMYIKGMDKNDRVVYYNNIREGVESFYEYNDRGDKIKYTNNLKDYVLETEYKYDSKCNMIYCKNSNGEDVEKLYDKNNNTIYETLILPKEDESIYLYEYNGLFTSFEDAKEFLKLAIDNNGKINFNDSECYAIVKRQLSIPSWDDIVRNGMLSYVDDIIYKLNEDLNVYEIESSTNYYDVRIDDNINKMINYTNKDIIYKVVIVNDDDEYSNYFNNKSYKYFHSFKDAYIWVYNIIINNDIDCEINIEMHNMQLPKSTKFDFDISNMLDKSLDYCRRIIYTFDSKLHFKYLTWSFYNDGCNPSIHPEINDYIIKYMNDNYLEDNTTVIYNDTEYIIESTIIDEIKSTDLYSDLCIESVWVKFMNHSGYIIGLDILNIKSIE